MASATKLEITEHNAITGETVVRKMDAGERSQYETDLQGFDDYMWEQIRNNRNALLAASDWTQMTDAKVDAAAWTEYRQELRDLPQNTNDFENVTWPTPPAQS